MKHRTLHQILLALFFPLFLSACDPIEKVDSKGFDRYKYKVTKVFSSAFKENVTARCILTGGTENAVFITDEGVVYVQKPKGASIWNHEYLELYRDGKIKTTTSDGKVLSYSSKLKDLSDVPGKLSEYSLSEFSRPLPEELFVDILNVWKDALSNSGDQSRIGLDGGSYYYYLKDDSLIENEAKTWSPEKGTIPSKLVDLTYMLIYYAKGKKDVSALEASIDGYWSLVRSMNSRGEELERISGFLAKKK